MKTIGPLMLLVLLFLTAASPVQCAEGDGLEQTDINGVYDISDNGQVTIHGMAYYFNGHGETFRLESVIVNEYVHNERFYIQTGSHENASVPDFSVAPGAFGTLPFRISMTLDGLGGTYKFELVLTFSSDSFRQTITSSAIIDMDASPQGGDLAFSLDGTVIDTIPAPEEPETDDGDDDTPAVPDEEPDDGDESDIYVYYDFFRKVNPFYPTDFTDLPSYGEWGLLERLYYKIRYQYLWGYSILGIPVFDIILILLLPLFLEVPKTMVKIYYLIRPVNRQYSMSHLYKKISIIVPAHNEENVIEDTIESLIDLDYPNKEIIIVDDNSSDMTYYIAKKYVQRGQIKLVRKMEESSNKAKAINFGFKFATGEIIVCIDADTRIQKGSLKYLAAPLHTEDVNAVSGNVRVYNTDNLLGKMQAYEYLVAMEAGRRFNSVLHLFVNIPGAFGAFKNELFAQLGMMDSDTITEDFDMNFKLFKIAGRTVFMSDAYSWTVVPSTWKEWYRQRLRWARGGGQTLVKHSDILFHKRYGLRKALSIIDMVLMD
ncbi:MAG TPA: glycosyltransferase family 2 protein, partial [Candidatus Methanofastidiosa archaeon]|nr:glycosyltransferase family 2 protein [Candidatus Methanofastidiosa archaeon]